MCSQPPPKGSSQAARQGYDRQKEGGCQASSGIRGRSQRQYLVSWEDGAELWCKEVFGFGRPMATLGGRTRPNGLQESAISTNDGVILMLVSHRLISQSLTGSVFEPGRFRESSSRGTQSRAVAEDWNTEGQILRNTGLGGLMARTLLQVTEALRLTTQSFVVLSGPVLTLCNDRVIQLRRYHP